MRQPRRNSKLRIPPGGEGHLGFLEVAGWKRTTSSMSSPPSASTNSPPPPWSIPIRLDCGMDAAEDGRVVIHTRPNQALYSTPTARQGLSTLGGIPSRKPVVNPVSIVRRKRGCIMIYIIRRRSGDSQRQQQRGAAWYANHRRLFTASTQIIEVCRLRAWVVGRLLTGVVQLLGFARSWPLADWSIEAHNDVMIVRFLHWFYCCVFLLQFRLFYLISPSFLYSTFSLSFLPFSVFRFPFPFFIFLFSFSFFRFLFFFFRFLFSFSFFRFLFSFFRFLFSFSFFHFYYVFFMSSFSLFPFYFPTFPPKSSLFPIWFS